MLDDSRSNQAELERDRFGLKPLETVVRVSTEILGASRISVGIRFQPRRTATFVFTAASIEIEITGERSYKDRTQIRGGPEKLKWIEDEYEILNNWEEYLKYTRDLESFSRPTYDGWAVRHELCVGGEVHAVDWLNPEWVLTPKAMFLINAYAHLIKRANLDDLLA